MSASANPPYWDHPTTLRLDAELVQEILTLGKALEPWRRKGRRGATDRDLPSELEARRRALLRRHLGQPADSCGPPVDVLGDSHAVFFAGSEEIRFLRYRRYGWLRPQWINRGLDLLPCFRTFHLGPCTAWMAAEPQSSTRTREKIGRLIRRDLPAAGRLMLCFGEIDCRIHMPQRALAGARPAALAAATAARFVRLPLWLRERGFDVVVWGVAQASPRPEHDPEAALPAVGPVGLRLEITYAYNDALAAVCSTHGIPFVNIAGTFHPPAEPMPAGCFLDGVHLSQALMPVALRALLAAGVFG